jgi:hypothetical protein
MCSNRDSRDLPPQSASAGTVPIFGRRPGTARGIDGIGRRPGRKWDCPLLDLKDPPMRVDDFLAALERQGLAQTVAGLRQFADMI